MKHLTNIRSFFAIATVAGIAFCASPVTSYAQSAQSQGAAVPTAMPLQVAGAATMQMSNGSVAAITAASERTMIGEQLQQISLKSVGQRLAGTFDQLTEGKSIQYASQISTAQSISGQNALSVKVDYEARPVGGILTVHVDLLPLFAGIGAASRPLASLEVSQAVDDLDEGTVHQIITDLSHKLGSDYAAKGN